MKSLTKILIADDSNEIAKRLVAIVSPINNVTVVGPASDGKEAIRLFHEHSPDVALLDLQMPYFTGIEVLEVIRQENSKCVVIILTGKIEPALHDRCIAAGANYFLSKVMDFGRIPQIIRSL